MNWLELTIFTSKLGLETITGVLLQLGVTGFVVEDPDDFEDFMSYQGKTWDYMEESVAALKDCNPNIKFYLADNIQGQETYIAIKNALVQLKAEDAKKELGSLELTLGNVNEEDWANNWKKYFKPFTVGERFVIKPTWETYKKTDDRMILEIDPNSSFGTGQHYTTQLCIEALEKYLKQEDCVLDMGCGSGILSIAAHMLGAKHVTAVDIDQNSVDIANENFNQNTVPKSHFNTYCGNILDDEILMDTLNKNNYDLVVANIVADVIIAMKHLLKHFVKPGGMLIASGIIGDRMEEVKAHLEEVGFLVLAVTEKNDWVAISATAPEMK